MLTSFNSRRLLRCAVSSRSRCRGRQGLGRVRQRVLDRAEHQGQRRAELVRHVGEEGRLRPVEFRQGLGPLLLLLVGPGVGDGGADLARDQLEEPAVLLVEPQPRADPGYQETGRLVGPGRRDGEHDGRGRGDPTRDPAEPLRSGRPARRPPRGESASITSASGQPAPAPPSRSTTRGLIASPRRRRSPPPGWLGGPRRRAGRSGRTGGPCRAPPASWPRWRRPPRRSSLRRPASRGRGGPPRGARRPPSR